MLYTEYKGINVIFSPSLILTMLDKQRSENRRCLNLKIIIYLQYVCTDRQKEKKKQNYVQD